MNPKTNRRGFFSWLCGLGAAAGATQLLPERAKVVEVPESAAPRPAPAPLGLADFLPPSFFRPALGTCSGFAWAPVPCSVPQCKYCDASPCLDDKVSLHRLNPHKVPAEWCCETCRAWQARPVRVRSGMGDLAPGPFPIPQKVRQGDSLLAFDRMWAKLQGVCDDRR